MDTLWKETFFRKPLKISFHLCNNVFIIVIYPCSLKKLRLFFHSVYVRCYLCKEKNCRKYWGGGPIEFRLKFCTMTSHFSWLSLWRLDYISPLVIWILYKNCIQNILMSTLPSISQFIYNCLYFYCTIIALYIIFNALHFRNTITCITWPPPLPHTNTLLMDK